MGMPPFLRRSELPKLEPPALEGGRPCTGGSRHRVSDRWLLRVVILRQREGDHRVTQNGTVARLAAKAVDDVLAAVDDIKGWRGTSAACIGHRGCIEGPQDLTRLGIRSMEEPVAFAEEDQVAGYSHARVGSSASYGNLPGNLSRTRVCRSVYAVIHLAGYRGECDVVRLVDPDIYRRIIGVRVDEVGSRAISRGRPFHSSAGPWLEHRCRWLIRRPLGSSDDAGRDRELFRVLGQGFNRGYGLGRPGRLPCRLRGNRHFLVGEKRLPGLAIQNKHVARLRCVFNGRNAIHGKQHCWLRAVKVPHVMVGKLEMPLVLP